AVNARSRAATLVLDDVDPSDDGLADYSGPLVDDLDFAAFSRSALVRMADEVVLQQHLLNLSFQLAVRKRAAGDDRLFERVARRQLVGHAGVAAERLHRALGLGDAPQDAAEVVELHPLMNPLPYVRLERDGDTITVSRSPAHEDGGWLPLCTPEAPGALQAIVRAVNPFLDVETSGTATDWTARVVATGTAAPESGEVAVTKISGGAGFRFEPRTSLPIFVKRAPECRRDVDGAYGDRAFLRTPTRRCRAMKANSRTLMAMRVHHELSVPSKVRIVLITPSTSTPRRVPNTYPEPPVSTVPPMTTAAIASSSIPTACSPSPDRV